MNSPLEYFEIFDGGDMVRVGVIEVTNNPSIDHRDKIWLETLVTAKAALSVVDTVRSLCLSTFISSIIVSHN
ncbi:hypothetical protein [Mucilaginibacter jinjuensis]|uniref:Uncharacterized protein n=1 Tax=Mucilaginibacter jinjuensis TaxID=1176721 RepID=A0ABY7TA83_9SPHI|nr:hypothetical protein [Mucilaginibacter jinjuensis]WCT13430.1 hypothetical protein PQO05_05715 [Mucilaginibacter jinjuensis]